MMNYYHHVYIVGIWLSREETSVDIKVAFDLRHQYRLDKIFQREK
jgi:hypothetical protein